MNLHPPEEGLCANVIIDGVVMERHLKSIGKKPGMARPPDEEQKIKSVKDVLLATCDTNGSFSAYLYNQVQPKNLFD